MQSLLPAFLMICCPLETDLIIIETCAKSLRNHAYKLAITTMTEKKVIFVIAMTEEDDEDGPASVLPSPLLFDGLPSFVVPSGLPSFAVPSGEKLGEGANLSNSLLASSIVFT
eukprot:968863_1